MTDYILLEDINIKIFSRDSIIRLQSLIHRQLSAKRFNPCIRYSWYKCGYYGENEKSFGDFTHPIKYLFPDHITLEKCSTFLCEELSFLKCAVCERILCFKCWFIEYHRCDN